MGDVRRTLDGVWRIESARLIAGIARVVRDAGLAEDLAQEAFVAALEQWPESGVPDNPGAWLMATAKHRAIDRLRRAGVHDRKTQELAREAISEEPALREYHLLPTVRGDLLERLGRKAEAGREFQHAAAMTGNARERAVLLERMAACAPRNGS